MKQAIVILLFALSSLASATTYYVSSTGNDLANGLSESTPWKTIAKVNSSLAVVKSGDMILFKRGDTFYGTLKISKSGVAGSPITIGAYGSGNKPVITGFTTLTAWTSAGSGIYSIPVTCESSPEMVTIDGVQYSMGRWPNSAIWPETQTWLGIDSYSGVTSITDSELGTSGINWTGAELVTRNSTRNRISIYPITSHAGNTLTFSGGTTSFPLGVNWGYFIQNDKRTLDKYGEWYYDSKTSTFFMYFGSENPAGHTVKVATINSLITLNAGITYWNFDNLTLIGSNNTAIYGNWNHNLTIKNSDIIFCGHNGIFLNKSTYSNISNCIVEHCNDNGINIVEDSDYGYIGNNEISNIGLYPGMGQGLFESCFGIFVRGSSNVIVEFNNLNNTGYTSIRYSGNNNIIRNNFINNYCFIKEDGGAISYASGATFSNMKVLNNIILNGFGSPGGKPASLLGSNWVSGIYLDYYTTGGVEISGNTVAHVNTMGGILVSGSQNVIIKNNTIYDCSSSIRMQELGSLGSPVKNITMTGNIYFAKNATDTPLLFYSVSNDISQLGAFDYNYYARPLNNTKPILTGIAGVVTARTLADWQSLSGMDLNSKISPITLTDTANIDFYYNPTNSDKIFTLAKPMTDVKGTKYFSSITLAPFTSAVLMVDPNPAPAGTAPVYLSASIPTYPTIMVINYSLTLANIVPAPSVFTVMVNSEPRTVKSVIVDGTKVRLYLESGVEDGDIVTVSYTKPAVNPLQSVAGIPAASVSNQTVTHNFTGIPPEYISSAIPAYPTIMVMNYNLTLANIIPAASAFTVMVNSVPRTVKSVIVEGTMVRLYLESGVKYGDVVTVSYTRPSTNPLQSDLGVPAASLTAQPVTNNITGIPPVYVSSAIPTYPTLMVMIYNQTLANIVPAASAFTVMVNSVPRTVSSVVIDGTMVRLYLESGVKYGDIVTVSYTRPSTNPLQSSLGVQAESITAQPVTNNITGVPPVYVSSAIPTYPTLMIMNYNLTLANIVPATSAFTVMVNSIPGKVSSVVVDGTMVRLYLESGVKYGDIVTVSYTRPSTNPLQSALGVQAESISSQPVTNNITGVPPVYVSSAIPTYPTLMIMNYNLTLANIVPATSAFTVMVNSIPGKVSSVVVDGTMVRLYLESGVKYGDVVTVSYTRPSTNPLQSALGVQAESISSQPVANYITGIPPVYISSVIPTYPTLMAMNYDLTLANVVPASSAFTVKVNSVSSTVKSVAVSGTQVFVYLETGVVSGDIVTVSYTAPTVNPLQSLLGIPAASISNQPVSNNIIASKSLKASAAQSIYYEPVAVSGFVYELDASGSDTKGDNLSFDWSVPAGVSVSSTNGSKIRYLSPFVSSSEDIEFTLSISDGENKKIKYLPVSVMPYKPELEQARIIKAMADNYNQTDYPGNIADGNINTKWSANGDDQWLWLKLADPVKISYLQVTFLPDQKYESYFDIYASKDNISWDPVLVNSASCDFSGAPQIFDFPPSQSDIEYSYMKLIGNGNSLNKWNNFSEIRIFGDVNDNNNILSDGSGNISIYPNPAREYINVGFKEQTTESQVLRIYDLSGKLCFTRQLGTGISNIEIPIHFSPGVYFVKVVSGNLTLFSQKLIVTD